MPIRISSELPAFKTLMNENIFVMSQDRAEHQDIRPLKVVILNIMPKKIETESQLLRLLSNTPLQVDIDLLHVASHVSKNTSSNHLSAFYKTFDEIKDSRYDGMIITGGRTLKGASIKTCDDHRIAMSFSVAGLLTDGVYLDNPSCVNISFENFYELINKISEK